MSGPWSAAGDVWAAGGTARKGKRRGRGAELESKPNRIYACCHRATGTAPCAAPSHRPAADSPACSLLHPRTCAVAAPEGVEGVAPAVAPAVRLVPLGQPSTCRHGRAGRGGQAGRQAGQAGRQAGRQTHMRGQAQAAGSAVERSQHWHARCRCTRAPHLGPQQHAARSRHSRQSSAHPGLIVAVAGGRPGIVACRPGGHLHKEDMGQMDRQRPGMKTKGSTRAGRGAVAEVPVCGFRPMQAPAAIGGAACLPGSWRGG